MTNANDAAFASVGEGFGNPKYSANGLTKREYFAAVAMQGFANSGDKWAADPDIYKAMADCAVTWADALIEALNETK